MVKFDEVVKAAWEKEVTYKKSEVKGLLADPVALAKKGIVFRVEGSNVIFGRYNVFGRRQAPAVKGHEYRFPDFTPEVLAALACATDYTNNLSCNLLLYGQAGTGKSEFVHEVAKMAGFARCVQVNGREDMDSSDFLGDKTVVIDKESKQNMITFNKGPLYKAFIEGTELDENGDQVLYNAAGERVFDGSGNPRVVGKPALFFLDEFATVLPSVFLAVFNRAMEVPRNAGESRSIEVSADGGRVVKSHPGFAIIMAGNTCGKGTESESQMGYTAQGNQMDDSTLDRFAGTYEFGYNLDAEDEIIVSKLGDDRLSQQFMGFRDEIRKLYNEGKVATLLTTRNIVSVCNLAKMFEKVNPEYYLPLAIFRGLFSGLREREKSGWNEAIRFKFGVDVMAKFQPKRSRTWFPNIVKGAR